MVTILETRKESHPDMILVGKRYTDEDRDEYGSFGAKWGQWHSNGWFGILENCGKAQDDSYVGAMRITEQGFEYWIGMFLSKRLCRRGSGR